MLRDAAALAALLVPMHVKGQAQHAPLSVHVSVRLLLVANVRPHTELSVVGACPCMQLVRAQPWLTQQVLVLGGVGHDVHVHPHGDLMVRVAKQDDRHSLGHVADAAPVAAEGDELRGNGYQRSSDVLSLLLRDSADV